MTWNPPNAGAGSVQAVAGSAVVARTGESKRTGVSSTMALPASVGRRRSSLVRAPRGCSSPAAGKAAADDYNTNRYHKPQDEFDPAWNWGAALQDVKLYYTMGRSLADGDTWPNWYPTAEFRAVRDKSRAEAK
jgi:hypothetical protein